MLVRKWQPHFTAEEMEEAEVTRPERHSQITAVLPEICQFIWKFLSFLSTEKLPNPGLIST